jgi:hypothetical protein
LADTKSLLFLPDISGFTDFVRQTELLHSKHIISELLEVILSSNILGLEVAEIEGDAIFFYRQDYIPDPEKLIEQVRNMFINFHSHLRTYDSYRICQCGACSTASKLSLKFIVHLGTFDFIKINNFEKPHGEDVILAHKLLKNNIDHTEYLLLSENLFQAYADNTTVLTRDSQEVIEGSTTYKGQGKVAYRFILLDTLHDDVKEIPEMLHPDKNSKPVHFVGYINASKESVFEIVSNLEYRLKINRNASSLDFEKERVNRVGLVHECVINNQNYRIQTISNDFGRNRLVYGEVVEHNFVIRKSTTYTILEDQESGSKLRYEVHLDFKAFTWRMLSPVIRLVIRYKLKTLFSQLKNYCENEKLQ